MTTLHQVLTTALNRMDIITHQETPDPTPEAHDHTPTGISFVIVPAMCECDYFIQVKNGTSGTILGTVAYIPSCLSNEYHIGRTITRMTGTTHLARFNASSETLIQDILDYLLVPEDEFLQSRAGPTGPEQDPIIGITDSELYGYLTMTKAHDVSKYGQQLGRFSLPDSFIRDNVLRCFICGDGGENFVTAKVMSDDTSSAVCFGSICIRDGYMHIKSEWFNDKLAFTSSDKASELVAIITTHLVLPGTVYSKYN